MGEAKKRKERNGPGDSTGPGILFDAPEVKAVLEGGAPINLHLFGLGTVQLMMGTLTEEQLLVRSTTRFAGPSRPSIKSALAKSARGAAAYAVSTAPA
jgi:hypothetical protein